MTDIGTKAIPITPATVLEHASSRRLGPVILDLPEGPALCHDALSLTMITAEDAEDLQKFIVVIAVAQHDGEHVGSLNPFTPAAARNFAASLIDAANQIDGGANG